MASEFILSNNGKLKPTDANSAAGNSILITGGDSDNNDLAGGNITLEGGRGQGIGNGGSIIFKTASPGKSSGSTLGSLTERMIVYMDGNVGIGTTVPSANLHIQHNSADDYSNLGLKIHNGVSEYTLVNNNSDNLVFSNNSNPRVTFTNDGKVGIGTTSPANIIHVKNSSSGNNIISFHESNLSAGETVWMSHGKEQADMNASAFGFNYVGDHSKQNNVKFGFNNGATAITYTGEDSGRVAIAHTDPDCPLDVRGTAATISNFTASWTTDYININYSGHAALSIFATSNIGAAGFFNQSDSRIKKDIELVNDSEALNLVNALESKKYFYKDPRRKTENKIIGFIAQEVKEVLPSAVKECREFVADELREIPSSNFNGTTLTVDNIVWEESHNGNCRFFVSDDDEGTNEEMIDLVCNKDENDNYNGEFTFEKTWNKIIFFGKEITDFNIIDKPQIFALHHSAIQELSRQLDTEKAKTATLETQVADLLARVTALENA